MPMPNTYSFTKSDYASMLQHVVDLTPQLLFLYDPGGDVVMYHNQKGLSGNHLPAPAPASLRQLLGDLPVMEDWDLLDRNIQQLCTLKEHEIHTIRFRIRAATEKRGYRWCTLRQKVFWQDEGSGVRLILCMAA